MDEQAAAMLDEQSGPTTSAGGQASLGAFRGGRVYGAGRDQREQRDPGYGDTGGASRFFYVAKAATAERNAGLGGEPSLFATTDAPECNDHPTVKPIALMRWLVRLVTPPDGTVLDPFTGSGTTGCAAVLEGFRFVGIERDERYAQIARARLAHWGLKAA
jgi:site-specific DNA-methyltransferase (adenine-specific)